MKKFLLFGILSPLFALTLITVFSYYLLFMWRYSGPPQYFEIKEGETFSAINGRLKVNGFIASSRLFYRYAKWENKLNCFKEGTYQISSGAGPVDLINMFCEGKSITIAVTIPEGKNLFEVAKILESTKITTYNDFKKKAFDGDLLKKLGINGESVEGYLYPETYHFSPHTTAEKIIHTMVRLFKKKTENINYQKSHLSFKEILTLASIVEKETAIPSERKKIAGVFLNRLKIHMRLQSDPTTIYGIFEEFNGNLKKKNLLERTDYNTYKIDGLPPGPICNPSLQSLEAVLGPENHNFLYFVSKNNGEHVFSSSYDEHQKWVNLYQKQKRTNN